MTEKEKTRGRFLVVSALVVVFITVLSGAVWQWLNMPRPDVDCSTDYSCSVSIGSILYPAEYQLIIFSNRDRAEYISTRDGNYRIGDGKIKKYTSKGPEYPSELPTKVHRFYSLARAAAEDYRKNNKTDATQ